MKDFKYYCPVKIILNKEAHLELKEICKNQKVLLVYGKQAIKQNGVYQKIVDVFKQNNIAYVDYENVTNNHYQTAIKGIELCLQNQITCVVGIGGAIVMDMAKTIAFGTKHKDELNEYLKGNKKVDQQKLLTVLIPTYPSTGSETDDISDIQTKEGNEGRLKGIFADYALLNPLFTYSLNKENTAYSALVTFIQASVYYFDNANSIAKGFTKTVLKETLKSYDVLLENPEDYQARATLMWASAVTTMGVLDIGMNSTYPWSVYSIGMLPCYLHQLSYRQGVTLMYPYWLETMSRYHLEDLKNYFIDILDVDASLNSQDIIQKGVEKIKLLLEKGNLPIKASVYGKCPNKEEITKAIEKEYDKNFTKEEMEKMILKTYEG